MACSTISQMLNGIKIYLLIALDYHERLCSDRPCCKNFSAEEYKIFGQKAYKEAN